MSKPILTIDELIKFCETHNFTHFSSSEQGYPLAVKIPATFEIDEDDSSNHRGMLRLKYKLFHLGRNRNGSNVDRESAEEALPTIAHRPVLAYIHQLDNGEWDFHTHDMEVEEDENGEQIINYIESQVGAFSGYPDEKPYIAYDEKEKKDFVYAYAYIPEEYTKAAEILERKGGSKNSVELHIEEMSYDSKEKYLNLKKFYVSGSTLLGSEPDGTEIGEGMKGSRADIEDFKAEPAQFEVNTKLIKAIENLNETLSRFNINDSCGKEVEEVEKKEIQMSLEGFEEPIVTNDLSDPADPTDTEGNETEGGGTQDTTGDDTTGGTTTGGTTTGGTTEGETQQGAGDPSPKIDDDETEESKKIGYSIDFNGNTKEFGLGVSAKLEAVYHLVDATYGNEDNEWYRCELFEEDGYIEMYGLFSGKCYRQTYEEHDGEFSFTGERVEIFMIFVTQEERDALDSMKANYSEISDKLRKYEEEPQKMEILNSDAYALITDAEEFTELKQQKSHFDLSVDEVKAKADSILLDYAKSGNFSHQSESQANFVSIPVIQKKVGRYGMLFANTENKSK